MRSPSSSLCELELTPASVGFLKGPATLAGNQKKKKQLLLNGLGKSSWPAWEQVGGIFDPSNKKVVGPLSAAHHLIPTHLELTNLPPLHKINSLEANTLKWANHSSACWPTMHVVPSLCSYVLCKNWIILTGVLLKSMSFQFPKDSSNNWIFYNWKKCSQNHTFFNINFE